MASTNKGIISLLNGASSSGKSALLKELHKCKPDLLQLKVDDFFVNELKEKACELGWHEQLQVDPWLYLHNYLTQKTGKYYFDTELREILFTNIQPMYRIAKDFALAGKSVIIDTVLEYESAYQQLFDFFKDSRLNTFLLYCPLDVLLERVNTRNACGKPEEFRHAFLSFEQFPAMYKVRDKSYQPIVDSVKTDLMKSALVAAIQELIDHNIPKEYFPKLETFKIDFVKQFKLDEQDEILLAPRHRYALIFNSKINTPQEIAQKLMEIEL